MAENKKVLVIGGGFSGLTAAVETAEYNIISFAPCNIPFDGKKSGRATPSPIKQLGYDLNIGNFLHFPGILFSIIY